jgi:hypothetical protein
MSAAAPGKTMPPEDAEQHCGLRSDYVTQVSNRVFLSDEVINIYKNSFSGEVKGSVNFPFYFLLHKLHNPPIPPPIHNCDAVGGAFYYLGSECDHLPEAGNSALDLVEVCALSDAKKLEAAPHIIRHLVLETFLLKGGLVTFHAF